MAVVDSVVLAETDSAFVGEPTGFTVMPDGRYWISDRRNAVLHVYDSRGTRLFGVGRRGEGPGEWSMGPTVIVRGHDSVVFVGDGPRLRALDPRDGAFRWERLKNARQIATAARGNQVFLNHVRRDRRTIIDAVSGPSDSAVTGGPFPELLSQNQLVGDYFSFLSIGFTEQGRMLVGVQSSDYLFIGAFPGGPFDSVRVPPLRRRGSVPELLRAVDARNPQTGQAAMYKPSYPWAIAAMPEPEVVASITADLEQVSGRMTGRLFVSFVDVTRRKVCPDIPVAAPVDPLPWVAVQRDTLFVLTQEVPSERSYTVVRKFALRPDLCAWQAADE